MAKEKNILETLVAKFNKTPHYVTRVEKDIEITLEEAEWAEEHKDELMRAFSEAARKRHSKYNMCPYLEVLGESIVLVMEK